MPAGPTSSPPPTSPRPSRQEFQHKYKSLIAKLQALHGAAQQAGVTVVNECGVDPGIDHFLAMECFDDVHMGGGKVESFVSFCGGLPAPECSDNPLGYKFSWSPRGALLNMLSGAR